ncbi:hypothetical protein [Nocardia sp. NPDC050175]|uniref:hypothetical protein n=1 Tax=Nocardia sp. NPDC050175 TaxID=3364317 RepID=UPI0037B21438
MTGKESVDLSPLRLVDDQSVVINAPSAVVWRELGAVIGRAGSRGVELGGRLLRLRPAAAAGDPLFVGSALPGFAIVRADPQRELALTGRHRFSTYAVIFHLATEGEQTTLRAETHADFPGMAGRLYKAAVIDTRLGTLGTRALLRMVQRRAQR